MPAAAEGLDGPMFSEAIRPAKSRRLRTDPQSGSTRGGRRSVDRNSSIGSTRRASSSRCEAIFGPSASTVDVLLLDERGVIIRCGGAARLAAAPSGSTCARTDWNAATVDGAGFDQERAARMLVGHAPLDASSLERPRWQKPIREALQPYGWMTLQLRRSRSAPSILTAAGITGILAGRVTRPLTRADPRDPRAAARKQSTPQSVPACVTRSASWRRPSTR